MTAAGVEILIACHSTKRPLARAVSSIVAGNSENTQVTVIAHNIEPSTLAATLPAGLADKVNWLSLNDGVFSPANPFNFGLTNARSPWISFMGSDDYLQPGAVAQWGKKAQSADAVITRLVHDSGAPVHTPPIRPLRGGLRSAVKDRLYYRSAPLGALRRSFLTARAIRFDPDLSTGDDIRMSAELWSHGRVRVQSSGPGYVIGSDAGDRVTMRVAPLVDELAHVDLAWNDGWANRLSNPKKQSLGTKYLRIHFFGAAYYRALQDSWNEGDRETLSAAAQTVLAAAPNCEKPLSLADRDLLDAIVDLAVPDAVVNRLALARRRFGGFKTLIVRDLNYSLHREAPLRFMTSSALVN